MREAIKRRHIQQDVDLGDIHPLLKRLYLQRGVQSATELQLALKHLLPYDSLSNITQAVDLLCSALRDKKHILIIGDFDTDGATSTVLAINALDAMGAAKVSFLVPNRFEYGYGLTPEIVALAAKLKPDVLITVDNGISSIDGVNAAKQVGYQVLITDHHLPGDVLPAADAIVNPNLVGDQFASKNLAGVGVIFYVMLALRASLRASNWFVKMGIAEPNMAQFLDLVALGTVADVVPLDHNNRILVHQGLRLIQQGRARPGIKALLMQAKREAAKITASDLGFAIAPRLNAAGRLDDMSIGIACLLRDNVDEALKIAALLDELNQERKAIENDMKQQAFQILKHLQLSKADEVAAGICLYNHDWHQGVIGILASRIKEAYHRPVIAFAPVNANELKGSGRSISGLHMRDALALIASRWPDLIIKFGGHAMAAGLSIHPDNYAKFAEKFQCVVSELCDDSDFTPEILSDGELSDEQLNLHIAELIRDAGPWGQHFPTPQFDGEFRLIDQRIVGGKHLKCVLRPPESEVLIDAIAFNVDEDAWPNRRCTNIYATYELDINDYRGHKKIQLILNQLESN